MIFPFLFPCISFYYDLICTVCLFYIECAFKSMFIRVKYLEIEIVDDYLRQPGLIYVNYLRVHHEDFVSDLFNKNES
jgi:hypothetical protein